MRSLTGSVYGRRVYEVMRYWDEDHPDWTADERDFATTWRSQPKWVISRSLTSVGPNATLVSDEIEAVIRAVRAILSACPNANHYGTTHLFVAAPNAFTFFLGQRQPAFGRVRLYEFDFERGRDRSYSASLSLPLPQPA